MTTAPAPHGGRELPQTSGVATPRGQGSSGRPRSRASRRLLRLAALALLVLLALDLQRPPASQRSAQALLGAIHWYQAHVSAHLAALGVRCRFRPTCSHYAEGAIARYGALGGSGRAIWRIARCGPWTPAGTFDPP